MKKQLIYLAISLITFLCGLIVAFFINQRSFMRGFAGDILIVIFIYSSVKFFLKHMAPKYAAAGVFIFAVFIEFIQYTGLPKHFKPGSMLIILTLGGTYDPLDIAAYATGVVIIYIFDSVFIQRIK